MLHPLPRRVAALLAAVALVLAACADRAPQPSGAVGEQAAERASDEPAPEPDVLEDPGVGPGECAMVTYTPPTAQDAFEAQLCRPEHPQRDVAVVVVHGGSGVSGSYHSVLGWQERLLAEGYVTLLPSYHLFEPGSAESPVFPRPEQNIKAAVQYLRGTGGALGIRKDRIVVQGHSAGARLAAVAFTTPDDPSFAGDELHDDISDSIDGLVAFYHPYDGSMQFAAQYYGGSEDSGPDARDRWQKADALSRASSVEGPALFVTGSNDWSLIDDQQDEFSRAVRRAGHPSRSIVIDRGGHGFDLGGERLTRLGEEAAVEVLRFLNEVFPQDPPRRAQQAPVDLDRAPTGTGAPATSVPSRPRTTTAPTTTPTIGGATTTTTEPVPVTDPPPTSSSTTTSTTVATTTTAPTTTTSAVVEPPDAEE